MSEGPNTEPVSQVTTATPPPEPAAPAAKKGMKRSTRIALIIILIVALLVGAAFAATYIIDTRNYVSTDNAQIDGDKIDVNAPASGTLIDWTAQQGTELKENHVVGRIKIEGGFVQPQMSIKAPADATVVVDNGIEGSFVSSGTELAVAYDFSKIFVTARVDETDVDSVHPGQQVDISVDAFPDVDLVGTVTEIQGGAAGVFSLFPQANTSGTFQKVTQVIPVKIALGDTHGLALVPGMNVSVKIHKKS